MRVEILVEEPSAEEALRHVLPKLTQAKMPKIINMGSKHKLLKVLPQRLKAYRKRINNGEALRIVVLVDRDSDDCTKLKNDLERMARAANLSTKSSPNLDGEFIVINRIVVEELESWFIGDPVALRKAFPSLAKINPKSKPFQNPDNGGSWEALHKFLKRQGIYRNNYPKIEAARRIAPHMDIHNNRSKSFQIFISGIKPVLA